jgi:hypothetical protein
MPQGDDFQISWDACHPPESDTVITDSFSFDHHTTTFLPEGRHESVDCRQSHSTLELANAESNCTACHLDMHQQSAGDQWGSADIGMIVILASPATWKDTKTKGILLRRS